MPDAVEADSELTRARPGSWNRPRRLNERRLNVNLKPRVRMPRRLLATLFCASAALVGCQGSPVTQLADVPDPSNFLGEGGVQWVNADHGGGATVQGSSDAGSRTFYLDASKGGKFVFGRYTVTFPANTVAWDGWVTIGIPSGVLVGCDLSISPAALNHFSKPVTLTINCQGTNVTKDNIAGLSIFWKAPGGWVNVGDDTNPQNLTVSADLQHFSSYRAGW
jgi:hypothetical protein